MKIETDFEITRDLQETIRKNPLIKNVYFAENGDHYFNKYKIKIHTSDDRGFSIKVDDVEALPGATFGVLKVVDANKKVTDHRVNVGYTPIAATFTREEVLNSVPIASSRSEKEKLEILAAAAEISKSSDFESLMKKLNGK